MPPRTSSIRLLSIKPGSGREVLECSLRITDLLLEAPTYTALSYSWTKDAPWSERVYWSFHTVIWENFSGTSIREQWDFQERKNQWDETTAKDPGQKYQDDATEIIICDGDVIKVTPSLYDALLQLRRRSAQEYWIDALCINQGDNEEKNSQVQMMGQIYGEAELVLVWLGTVPSGPNNWCGDIDSSLQRLVSFLSGDPPEGLNKSGVCEDTTSASRSVQPVFMDSLAICQLVTRRYFQRLWVVQEIALSKNLTFLLGEHYFGPETFLKVANYIKSPKFTRTGEATPGTSWFGPMVPRLTAQFASLPLPYPSQPAKTGRTGTWSLHDWLEACMGRKAVDDKDLAFAGLGLVRPELLQIRQSLQLPEASPTPLPPQPFPSTTSPVCLSPPPLPPQSRNQAVSQEHPTAARCPGKIELWPRLKADYSTSRHEALVNLAACVLSGPNPTSLLSISSRCRARSMLPSSSGYNPTLAPSWVPALAPWSKKQHKVKSLGDYGIDHSAATDVQNYLRISSDGSTLFLSATRLGIVQDRLVSPGIDSLLFTKFDVIGEKTLTLVKKLSKLSTSYRDTDRSHLAALASASTWGLHGRDQRACQDAILGFCLALDKDFNDAMHHRYEKIEKRSALDSLLDSLFNSGELTEFDQLCNEREEFAQTKLQKVKEELPEAFQALKKAYPDAPWPKRETQSPNSEDETRLRDLYSSSCMLESVRQQRLFTTDTGYVGQTMTGVKSGDVVVLVHGAPVPYILRRVDDAIRAEIDGLRYHMLMWARLASNIPKRQKMMRDLEAQLGTRNGWVVVGEAYVEGVMNGEAVCECIKRGERFSLV